jgi:hypothetical protein
MTLLRSSIASRFKRSSDASSNLSLIAPISSFNSARFVAGHASPISDENGSLVIFDSLSIWYFQIFSFSKRERSTRPISKAKVLGWEICWTFCSRGPDRRSAQFPREDDSLQPPAADQSNCAGVGVGVGVTEADGSGEGDSPVVEKFEPMGLLLGNGLLIGTGMNWG